MIDGVLVQPLKIIKNERGDVLHMLRRDDPVFKQFGEIYFSYIHSGYIKGWKKHLKQTQYFAVPVGNIKLVVYDDRPDSPSVGKVHEIEMGIHNYCLVQIPFGVWYSFRALDNHVAMVANCADIPHDPRESLKASLTDEHIPYRWNPPSLEDLA